MADLMETLRLACDDPMWADHVEMPKKLLRHAIDRLESLEAERALAERAGGVKVSDILSIIALWSDDEGLDLSFGQGDDLARRILSALSTEPAAPEGRQEATSRVKVPDGQTPLNDDLGHRLLDVFAEGGVARENGTGSPYHGHSLEHCLHAAGWVQRDLRLALDAAKVPRPAEQAVTDEAIVVACQAASVNWTLSGEQVLRLYRQVDALTAALAQKEEGR